MNKELVNQLITHLESNVREDEFDIELCSKCVLGHSLKVFPERNDSLRMFMGVTGEEKYRWSSVIAGTIKEFPTKQSVTEYMRKHFL